MKNKPKIKITNQYQLKKIIDEEIALSGNNCDLNFIDTSNITDMSNLFAFSKFNGDISKWNTSNVIDMSGMFYNTEFNGNISNWNTSNVQDMAELFRFSTFNGNISDWNINNLIKMKAIFKNSKSQNVPYWAKINDYNERIKAYHAYHAQKEKDLILNGINSNNNLIRSSNHNTKIIKI